MIVHNSSSYSSCMSVGFLKLVFLLHIKFSSAETSLSVSLTPTPRSIFFLTLPHKSISSGLFHLQNLKPQNRSSSSFYECPICCWSTTVRYNRLHPTLFGTSLSCRRSLRKPDFCVKQHHFVWDTWMVFLLGFFFWKDLFS